MATKTTKKDQQKASKDKATLSAASNIKLDASLGALGTAGVRINNTLASIQEELIAKHSELQSVDNAIALKRQEMEELHGKDKVLLSMDELEAAHASEVERIATEREELKRNNEDLEEQLQTARSREQAEYDYNLAQKRKKDDDSWQDQLATRAKINKDNQEKLEKSWTDREVALQAKENDYKAALDKIATFDAEVKRAADRDVAIATNSLNKEHKHQNELRDIQHKSEVDKLAAEVVRNKETIAAQDAVIAGLQAQLQKAHEANTNLASKVAEAAANKQAVADMQSLITNVGGNGARPRS